MGSGALSKKYSGTAVEPVAHTPAPKRSLTIEEVAAGRISQPKVCDHCVVPLMIMQGAYGKVAHQCPQCGWRPDRRSLSKNNLDIAPPNPGDAMQPSRGSSKSSTRRPSKEKEERRPSHGEHSRVDERRPSKEKSSSMLDERRPSKEKVMSRSSSKATTEAPFSDQDSPLGSTGELPALQRVVKRRSTTNSMQRRSTSLTGVNEDIGFAPGDKVVFEQYDAVADDFGIGVITSLGERPGIVRVKFEKSERTFDFKANTLKKLSKAEENSLKHGSKLARRNSMPLL